MKLQILLLSLGMSMVFTCTILAQTTSLVECVDEDNNPYPEIIISNTEFIDPSDCINDGHIKFNATVASGTLEFRLNGGEWYTEHKFDTLWAGNHVIDIRILDLDCTKKSISAFLEPRIPPMILDTTVVQLTDWCREDATIEIFASEGEGPLMYSIDSGATWQAETYFDSLPGGRYPVVVSNFDNTCFTYFTTIDIKILHKPRLLDTKTVDPSDCGARDGAIILFFTEIERDTYGYAINNEQHDSIYNPFPPPITEYVDENSYDIFHGPMGHDRYWTDDSTRANVPIISGDDSIRVVQFTGLGQGQYEISYRRNMNVCITADDTLSLVDPPSPSFNLSVDPTVNCEKIVGDIRIRSGGGIPPLQYTIDGQNWTSQTTYDDLPPGTYYPSVRNSDGTCVRGGAPIVFPEYPLGPKISGIDDTDPSDCGAKDGIIEIIATSGSSDPEYSIDGQNWQANPLFTNLDQGTYIAMVRNTEEGTCLESREVVLSDPARPTFPVKGISNVAGNCATDGGITVSSSGGIPPLQYSIDNGVTFHDSPIFNNLGNATYNLVVRNSDETCVVEGGAIKLNGFSPPAISLVEAVQPSDCDLDDGKLIVHTQGSGDYEYSFDGGQTFGGSNTLRGLNQSDGQFHIIVRNEGGGDCGQTDGGRHRVFDRRPPEILDTIFYKNSGPCGANDGQISITILSVFQVTTDDGDFYEFRLNDGAWQVNAQFNDLAPGNYVPQFRHRNGTCIVTEDTITIEGDSGPTLNQIFEQNASSCTASDGFIEIRLNNITKPMEYTRNGGNTWQSSPVFGGLQNQEIIQIGYRTTDSTCVVLLGREWLDAPSAPFQVQEPVINAINCDGNQNGSIRLFYASLSGLVLYSMNGGAWRANGNFPNLSPGNYSFRVRNIGNTCITPAGNFTIANAPINITRIISNNPDDCGEASGNIRITASGGGTHEYSINGGVTWQSDNFFDNLPAGHYPIQVRNDDNSCVNDNHDADLVDPDGPEYFFGHGLDPGPCLSNGVIYIEAVPGSGEGSYEYSLNGIDWQSSNTFRDLDGGTYQTYIRNSDRNRDGEDICPIQGERITLESAPITPEIEMDETILTDPTTCSGAGNGIIEVRAVGGNPPYEYSINGGNTWQPNPIFNSLSGGNYTILVRNSTTNPQCVTSTGTLTLTSPPIPAIRDVSFLPAAPCQSNGRITITPVSNSGTRSFEYSISGRPWQTSRTFFNLAGGTYTPLIRNAGSDCSSSYGPVEISNGNPIAPVINNLRPLSPKCNGGNDGQITITASGGNPPFEYSRDNGNTWQDSNIFPNLVGGNYNVAVRNKNETCIVTFGQVTLLNPEILTLSVQEDITPSCTTPTGKITLLATGGNGTYEYRLKSTDTWTTNRIFANLIPDTYQPEVRIQGGTCVQSYGNYVLAIPNVVEIQAVNTITPANCDNNGQITIIAKAGSGSGNYHYSLDGTAWQVDNFFRNLTGGSYSPRIRDNTHNCIILAEVVDFSADVPVEVSGLSINVQHPNCDNELGDITVSGNTAAYEFSINNGLNYQVSPSFSNIGQGTYQIWVRNNDATCPIFMEAITLIKAPPPTISVSITQPIECAVATGQIIITGNGGSTPYKYRISQSGNLTNQSTFNNLAAGTYYPAIANSDGTCIIEYGAVTINTVNIQPTATISIVAPTDCGTTDGTLTVNASGGNNNGYKFRYNNGALTNNNELTGLAGGSSYDVKVYNFNNTCVVEYTNNVIPEKTSPLVATVTTVDPSIGCREDGKITVRGSGGSGTYSYRITGAVDKNWQNSTAFRNLPPGNYTIFVRNRDGSCEHTHPTTVTLDAPIAPELIVDSFTHPTGCGNADDGRIVLRGECGTGPYQFSIDNGVTWQTSGTFTGLGTGTYRVKIKNANDTGISTAQTVNLIGPTAPSITSATGQQPSDCNLSDGSIKVVASTATGDLLYSNDGGVTWQSSDTFTGLSGGTYPISVKNADETCSAVSYGTVTLIDHQAPTVGPISRVNPSDCGAADGRITISVSGGDLSGNYRYKISGKSWQTSPIFNNLRRGTYFISVTNGNGTCLQTVPNATTLTDPVAPMITAISENPDGCGMDNGSITISGTSGHSGSYQYSIDGGSTWENSGVFLALANGNYPTRIRNLNETCVTNGPTLTLNSDTLPTVNRVIAVGPTDCGQMNGSISIIATGGNQGTLQYSIDNGMTWETTGNNFFGNLSVGTYIVKVRNSDESCEYTYPEPVEVMPHIAPTIDLVTVSQPTDCWEDDGKITIIASGGDESGKYEYSLDGLNWQSASTFDNLAPTKTPVFVRNRNNTCVVSYMDIDSVELYYPIAPILSTTDSENPTGCGSEDGFIHVTGASGNNTGYIFSIDGGMVWQNNGDFDNLPNSIYSILIGNGDSTCQYLTPIIELTSDSLPAIANVIITHPEECGELGAITATYTGGNSRGLEHSPDGGQTWYDGVICT